VGDTVGLAAPAGPLEESQVRAGIEFLEGLGLKVRVPSEVFDREGFFSGTDQTRARVLRELLLDPDIRAVFCTRGGSGSLRLLPLLGLDRLPGPPKILVGFSDLTALLLALNLMAGWRPFHGPLVASFASADQATRAHLADLLFGRKVFPLSLAPGEGIRVLKPGRAEGPLLGGNLTLLVHLLATPFRPNLEGAILFLEDAHEAPYRLDRMLTTLRLAGVLDRLAGLVLGHFDDCGPPDEVRRVLEMNLADFPGPVVADFPIGHGTRNLALPIGPRALLDTEALVLDLLEPYLADPSV
jgi:muramoyltetrapeptide carboxypeptidase